MILLGIIFFGACNERLEQSQEIDLKKEIFEMYQSHIEALTNLDHARLMSHYEDEYDHVLFGDGEYWGKYQTVDAIWKGFIQDTKEILEWNISNEHVNLLSDSSASYLMEFYNVRINKLEDTLKVRGSVSYGLKKLDGIWKIVTTNVSHYEIK